MINRATTLAKRSYALLPPLGRRFAKYAVCGAIAVSVDFSIYSAMVWSHVDYQFANLISTIAGLSVSFTLNRAITYRVFDAPLRRAAMFFTIGFAGYILGSLALHLLIEDLHINPFIAKLVALALAVAAQFTLNSLITFREARPTTSG
jgi:putative flippase GtrA